MDVNLNESDKVTAFDTLFTTNHMRICKILLPHMDRNMQKVFSIYIKLSELSYTITYFKHHPNADMHTDSNVDSFIKICEEIMPYSTAEEKDKLSKISSLFGQIKNIQEMYEMYQMFSDMMPDSSAMSTSGSNPEAENTSFDTQLLAEMLKMMQS